LGAGENPEWIAMQLGHSTTEMLFRVYSRYVPNLTRRDGSAFERLLSTVITPAHLQSETAENAANSATTDV
jgi:integrase